MDLKAATDASWETIVSDIDNVTAALETSTASYNYAVHRCVTTIQQAHYDKKIAAERTMWNYGDMSGSDMAVFDEYIVRYTSYHQE